MTGHLVFSLRARRVNQLHCVLLEGPSQEFRPAKSIWLPCQTRHAALCGKNAVQLVMIESMVVPSCSLTWPNPRKQVQPHTHTSLLRYASFRNVDCRACGVIWNALPGACYTITYAPFDGKLCKFSTNCSRLAAPSKRASRSMQRSS